MTKVIENKIFVCSDCQEETYRCIGCENYFENNQEIVCKYGEHYCLDCLKAKEAEK